MRGIYRAALNDKLLTDRLIAAVPAAEHVATVEMVRAGSSSAAGSAGSLDVARALLEEAGGPPVRAVKPWRAAPANQPEAASPLGRRADAAIKRLAR